MDLNSFQFLGKIGVSGVECVDVFSFDQEMLEFLPSPQLALILCFPEREGARPLQVAYDELKSSGFTAPENVFFMKQKIGNACGTFALFHALANLEGVIDLGKGSFYKWLSDAKQVSVEERSDLLLKNDQLAAAHEETAREGETEEPENVEHHFICYVERNGVLYEIDSCAPFPRPLGNISGEVLVSAAGKHVKKLMEEIDGQWRRSSTTSVSICTIATSICLMPSSAGWMRRPHSPPCDRALTRYLVSEMDRILHRNENTQSASFSRHAEAPNSLLFVLLKGGF